ncbi:MAG: VTT domain-containing protein [Clostridiaceae bacterium]|nr:VTT domain-containing protein [Clostridiaceae bacterium]
MKSFRLYRNIVLILLIFILTLGIYIGYLKGYSWQDLWELVSGSTINSILAIICLYCLKIVLWVIPINALYLGAGFLFPPWLAIAVTYMGLILDLTLSFYLGRFIEKSWVMDEIKKRKATKWMLDMADKNSAFACFVIRLLPGPPTEVTNMFFGALNMQYSKFLVLSLMGITPGMLPVIFLGKAAVNPRSKEFIILLLISLLIAAGSILIYCLVLKKHSKT